MIVFRPVELSVFTATEAVQYLRLDEDRELPAALRALERLVDKRLLRPCIVGNRRRYSRHELDRFVEEQTDRRAAAKS